MLSRKNAIAASAISIFFVVLLRFMIDRNPESPSPVLPLLFSASLLITGGFVALSAGLLVGSLRGLRGSATLRIFTRVSENPTRNFLIGFFITAYMGLLRSPIAAYTPYLLYVEWASIVLVVYALYSMTGFSTGSYASSEMLDWKKHAQEVTRETSRSFTQLASMMEGFVSHGVKEPLLVYLTLHLQRLGEAEEDILKILSPLMDYHASVRDEKSGTWAVFRKRREPAVNDKKTRDELLKALMNRIEGL